MRGIRAAGIGLGIAASASAALAQEPAARFGGVRPVDATVRAQAPAPPPAAQPPVLGQPRQLGTPNVTEQRGTTPAATFGPPVPYGGAIPVGGPVPVGPAVPVGPFNPSVAPAGPADPSLPAPAVDRPLLGAFTGPLGLLTGPNRFHLHADLLLWWVQSGRVPPLVTTSSPQFAGIIGQGDTRVLVADDFISNTFHTGGRFGGVYWLGCNQRWGIDGNVFFLGRNGKDILLGSDQNPVLARPFTNVNQGIQFSELVASPGLSAGRVLISNSTALWGAEVNARRYLASTQCARLDVFGGYRFLQFDEDLAITESFARTPGSPTSIGVPNALSGTVTDRFRTENQFHGVNLGLSGEVRRGRWFLEGRTSVAFGSVNQLARIAGGQTIQFDTGTAQFPGGLLALPGANIGEFSQNKFGFVPEVGLKVGVHVTPHLRLAAGYNFLYLNSVLRPGEQIDTGLDVTRIPNFPLPGAVPAVGGVRPAVRLRDTDVFAQGFTVSLQYNW